MMFRSGVFLISGFKKLSGYEVAEIALLTPTAPCHDLVPVRHRMSSSRSFPLLPAAPTPEASLGTTQFILPGPPDLLDVIPPWLFKL